MKKKLLTALLALVVVVGVIFAANAAETRAMAELQLKAVQTEAISITEDTVLDLNGYDVTANIIVAGNATLYIKDSKTDDSVEDGYGKITGQITGNWQSQNGYLKLNVGNEGYSFHACTYEVTNKVTIRTDKFEENGAAFYYTANFGGGDKAVHDNVVAYGIAIKVDGSGMDYFADGLNGGYTYTRATNWSATPQPANGAEITGVMKIGNRTSTNIRNVGLTIRCVPYVELVGGQRELGKEFSCSYKKLLDAVDEKWYSGATVEQRRALVTINSTFKNVIPALNGLDTIQSLVDPATNSATPFRIHDAFDLTVATAYPAHDFYLTSDIDMKGYDWTPFKNLTGSFDGRNKVISNLSIDGVGFFGTVAAGATVKDLHLRNASVVVPENSSATAVGIVAGTNNGSITGVTVAGSLKDTRAGSASAKIYAGVITGKNAGTVTVGTTNLISVSNAKDKNGNLKKAIDSSAGYRDVVENDLTTTGLSADAGLWLNEDSKNVVRGGLIGSGTAATNAANVIWSDRSYSTERQDAELQRRREVVEADVFEQGTMKWTPATEIRYYDDQANNSRFDDSIWGSAHIHNQKFVAGTTYYGVPYTHCASPVEQAKYYMTKNAEGVYVLDSSITTLMGGNKKSGNFFSGYTYSQESGSADWKSGNVGWGKYFGSDCSGGITGAWHKVSPILTSSKKNGGVCLYYTSNMVPSQYNQWYYGFKQVGDYEVDDATWSTWGSSGNDVTAGGVTMKDYTVTTEDIFQKIGENGFYEAYAQSQMGDITVAFEKEPGADSAKVGHARLIAADPVVVRNGNNVIDGDKSYFLFHEQGAGLYSSPGISSWRVNWKCSFKEAAMCLNGQSYGGNGNGRYLPITMNAFHNADLVVSSGITTSGSIITGNDPIAYALNSEYRIMSATMIIKDANGNTVYEATRFQGASSSQSRRRATPGYIPLFASDLFADCDDKLVEGDVYYVTFSGTTYSGVTTTKMNNYKIVYAPTPES